MIDKIRFNYDGDEIHIDFHKTIDEQKIREQKKLGQELENGRGPGVEKGQGCE